MLFRHFILSPRLRVLAGADAEASVFILALPATGWNSLLLLLRSVVEDAAGAWVLMLLRVAVAWGRLDLLVLDDGTVPDVIDSVFACVSSFIILALVEVLFCGGFDRLDCPKREARFLAPSPEACS